MRALLTLVLGLQVSLAAYSYDVDPAGRFELNKAAPLEKTGKAGQLVATGIFCSADGQKFMRQKTWPTLQDRIVLRFDPRSAGRGTVDYTAIHEGISGGDCKIEFTSEYEIDGQKMILKPLRSTLKEDAEWSTPCRAITVDQTRSFNILRERHVNNYGSTEILGLEGDDTTGLCPFQNSTVRFVFIRIK